MLDSPSIPLLNPAAWLGAAGVFGSAYAFGLLCCSRLRLPGSFDAMLVRLTVGLAVLPLFVLIAGQVEGALFLRPAWIALSVPGGFFAAWHAMQAARAEGLPADAKRVEARPGAVRIPLGTLLAAIPLVAWMLYLLGPLSSPPLNYDVLEYHQGVVPHFFELGRIDPIPHVFYSAQPIATEMLYTLASVLEGTPWGGASGYVQWMLTGLTGLLLWRTLERAGTARPLALLIPFGLLTHPILIRLQLDRMTDLTGATLLLGGWLLWLIRDRDAEGSRNLWIASVVLGLLAGGAVSSKWTNAGTSAWGIAMAPAVGLWIMREENAAETVISWLKAAGLFILGGGALLIPWMVWVWAETGNPIAPFGARWFPTGRWDAASLEFLLGTHGPMSVLSPEYWSRLIERTLSPRIGSWPLLLAVVFALLAWLNGRRWREDLNAVRGDAPPALKNLLVSGFLSLAGAFLLWGRLRHAADRFLAPAVVVEFLMLGAAVTLLLRNVKPVWRPPTIVGAFAVFIGAALASPVPPLAGATIYWDRATGRMTSTEFLQSGLGATTEFFAAANDLPEGSRLMAIGEARRYYFRHPVTLASVFDRHPIAGAVESAESVEGLRASLREAGYTHLAVNEYETARLLDFHPPPALEADPAFMEVRKAKNYGELVRRYAGTSEFGAHPLEASDRGLYVRFLTRMREEATYRNAGPEGVPAFWIAPL